MYGSKQECFSVLNCSNEQIGESLDLLPQVIKGPFPARLAFANKKLTEESADGNGVPAKVVPFHRPHIAPSKR